MKDWRISDIEKLTEQEAQALSSESMTIKEHTVYFVDFGGYFGYSKLVFKNNHHIRFANDYELHHKGKTKEELKEWYIQGTNNILFTEEEIAGHLTDYEEYSRKSYFLHNYYGMQVDHVSIFGIPTKDNQAEFDRKTATMIYNPVALAYMHDADFVRHHIELSEQLNKARENVSNNYEYMKSAFLYEMYNHEYGINWQADYDVLSVFGNVEYHDYDLNAYFDELNFTDLQRQAYLDARAQYYKESDL